MSYSFIWLGIVGIAMVGLITVRQIARYASGNSPAKTEKILKSLTHFFVITAVGGFVIVMGWALSYPTIKVNGESQSTAPASPIWLGMILCSLILIFAAGCNIAAARLKNRRVGPILQEWKRREKMLQEEFGENETARIMQILERSGINDELMDADREGR